MGSIKINTDWNCYKIDKALYEYRVSPGESQICIIVAGDDILNVKKLNYIVDLGIFYAFW